MWLPGKVTPEQAAFYVDLMKKVQATPEWKDYIEKTSQIDTFLTGDGVRRFHQARTSSTCSRSPGEQGWLREVAGGTPMISRRALETADGGADRQSFGVAVVVSRASTTASAGRRPASTPARFPS